MHEAWTYSFVVKQLQHMLVGDLALTCVRVRYCDVLSSVYFAVFLAELCML